MISAAKSHPCALSSPGLNGVCHVSQAGKTHFRTIALIVGAAMFMEQLDATVLATALPSMARELGVSAPSLSIALTSYLISLAVFIPVSTLIADRFGARTVFSWRHHYLHPGLDRLLAVAQCLFPGGGALLPGRGRGVDAAGGPAGAEP